MVHNYSTTENYSLSNGMPEWHLMTDEQGLIWLNTDRFILDIHNAYEKFKRDIKDCMEVRNAVLNHYREYKIIRQKR
jgi:hypothetical protein